MERKEIDIFFPSLSHISESFSSSEYIEKDIKCNLVMIGKTGVGKSSFGNYLFNEDIFKTGNGKPVTNFENNFENYSFMHEQLEINVYDSVGLEPDNFEKWQNEFNIFLRDFEGKNHLNFIHMVFYLINAKSARIEEKELMLIKKVRDLKKIPIQVVLTNCDGAEDNKISGIENALKVSLGDIAISRVSSVSRTARGGVKYEPFGKSAVLNEFITESYNYSCKRIALYFLEISGKLLSEIRYEMFKRIENMNLSILNIKNWETEFDQLVSSDFDEIFEIYSESYLGSFEKYREFLDSFNSDIKEPTEYDKVELFFESLSEKMSSALENIEKDFERIFNDLEHGSISEKIEAIKDVALFLVKLKENIKKTVNSLFKPIVEEIRTLSNELKNTHVNNGTKF